MLEICRREIEDRAKKSILRYLSDHDVDVRDRKIFLSGYVAYRLHLEAEITDDNE